jgi:hypothetical protein
MWYIPKWRVYPMTNARRIILSLLAGLTFTAAIWAAPLTVAPANVRLALAAAQGQKPQKMSGKISTIQKAGQGSLQDSFTIDTTPEKTEVFFMIPQTKVTGDFKVGNNADVTYGFDRDGNKIATEITITK